MREREKKSWLEPELIALVRSKQEEAVLFMCKTGGASSGISGIDVGCMTPSPVCLPCTGGGPS